MANSISQLCVEAFAQIQSGLKKIFKKHCSGKSLSKLNISFNIHIKATHWLVDCDFIFSNKSVNPFSCDLLTLFSYRNKSL